MNIGLTMIGLLILFFVLEALWRIDRQLVRIVAALYHIGSKTGQGN